MFVFGHPDDMPDTKPGEFETEEEAIDAAQKHFSQYPWDGLLAVWVKGAMHFNVLVYEGWVYRPE